MEKDLPKKNKYIKFIIAGGWYGYHGCFISTIIEFDSLAPLHVKKWGNFFTVVDVTQRLECLVVCEKVAGSSPVIYALVKRICTLTTEIYLTRKPSRNEFKTLPACKSTSWLVISQYKAWFVDRVGFCIFSLFVGGVDVRYFVISVT